MSMSERLIQLTLRAKNFLSRDIQPASDSVKELAEEGKRLKDALNEAGQARGLARALRDNEQAAAGLERAWSDAKATLNDLTSEVADNEQATAGQRIALREARKSADDAERAYKRNQSAIKNTTSELNALGVDTQNVAGEEQRLTNELDAGKDALAANRDAIKAKREEEKRAAQAAAEHESRVAAGEEAVSSATKKLLTFAAAYISVDAALSLVKSGLALVRDGIEAVFAEGSSGEQALGQLEAALASTGNAAGLTTEQLLEMAKQLRDGSMLGTEEIIAAQTRLLSYTDVAGKEFPRAMQIIIDQSQRLGIGVEQSAEIVGKALQSPADAMTTLGRQGFKLGDGQKQLIERLMATGKTAEAQAVIMDMLSEAYGGSAAAARLGTAAGLWKTLKDAVGDFAGNVADSGSFEFVKTKLREVGDAIKQMASDGRLDALAKALSDAFVKGAEKVEAFARQLLDIDFSKLTDDSAAWLSGFGEKIDDAATRVQLFVAPFRTLFNGLTSGLSLVAGSLLVPVQAAAQAMSLLAKAVPDTLGGAAFRESVKEANDLLNGLSSTFAAQVMADSADTGAAWETSAESAEQSATRQVAAAAKVAADTAAAAEKAQKAIDDLAATSAAASFKIVSVGQALASIKFADSSKELQLIKVATQEAFDKGLIDQAGYEAVLASMTGKLAEVTVATGGMTAAAKEQATAIEGLKRKQAELLEQHLKSKGPLDEYQKKHNALSEEIRALSKSTDTAKVSINGLQEAQDALSTASTVQGFKDLQAAFFTAYQQGKLTQAQYEQVHNAASASIAKLKASAGTAAPVVDALAKSLKTLADVQRAISDAKTDRDIATANAALKKMLSTGIIDGAQYNAEMKRSADRLKEIKTAIDGSKKAQDGKNDSDKEAIVTSAQLRKESGQRMEEERQAGDQAMQDRRKGAESAKSDMAGVAGFFDGVMSRAREPLAAMSAAALDAFDKLRGISTVDMSLDTGSLDETTASLTKATQALGDMQAATNTPMASGLGRWMADTALASQKIQVEFLGQKAQLQSLMEGYEQGGGSIESFISAAQGARSSLNLLNDSDLRTLEGAIEGARQKMQQLQEGSKATLTSLSEELMGLRGETEALERSKFASRRADLQQQIVEAQKGGDSTALNNLQQAMATLRQIEAETGQKRQTDEQQKRVDAVNNATKATQPAANEAPAKIIRLQPAKGPAVDVAVRSDADETNLLSVLESAGLRSL